MFNDFPDVMTVSQVAKALGLSTAIIYDLLHNGSIRHFMIGRNYRVTKKALVEYISFIQAGGCDIEAVPN